MQLKESRNWSYRTALDDSKQACCDVEEQAGNWKIAEEIILKLNLVTEELFQNTINHAVPRNENGRVEISMTLEDDKLILNYREQAPFFDPLKHEYDDTEEETVGGRGILLIVGMSINAAFSRTNDWNCLRLEFEL